MKQKTASQKDLKKQIESLTVRLQEAEETLHAIQNGEVDAIIVSGEKCEQVFSLSGADQVYRIIVETMSEAALTVTFDGTILFCNAQFALMIGSPLEQLSGHSLQELTMPGSRQDLVNLLFAGQSRPVKTRIVFQCASGPVPVQVSANLLSQPDGDSICIVATDLTIVEQKAQLLRKLAMQLTSAEQHERGRIAGILHDNFQQILVAARYHAELLLQNDGTNIKSITEKVRELLNQSLDLSRSLMLELNPPLLKKGDLVPSIKWLATWMHTQHGLTVPIDVHDEIPTLKKEIGILLFQSVRELLLNVAKHAKTDSASIQITMTGNALRILVSDNGAGFDPVMAALKVGQESFGLFSIQERLDLIGGRMETVSAPGKGSRFTLSVPL